MPGSFRIARILGIDVRVHFSWLLIFALVTFSLADQVFPFSYPQWSEQKTWIIAGIAALLFFVSVVLHEFAHSIVARAFKMSVSSITLFLLGGVASLTKEPPSARAEFFMAIAGPATSLAIGGLGLGVNALVSSVSAMPTWLCCSAPISFRPSPIMPTILFSACSFFTKRSLSYGV